MKNPLLETTPKKYKYPEAYCMIKYKGGGLEETLWNSRDGAVPLIIFSSKDGKTQLNRVKGEVIREKHHELKKHERYFAKTTKERALYLSAKIVEGRWAHPKYPLSKSYESKKVARFLIYKSLYGDGNMFTILKHGKDITMYLTKHFRNFISSDTPA